MALWSVHVGSDVYDLFLANARDAMSPATQAALLREVVGNPFRPVKLSFERLGTAPCPDCPAGEPEENCDDCGGSGEVAVWGCPWLTPTVIAVARRIYDERTFDALPILADALEDAGCTDKAVLWHLRGWRNCTEAEHLRRSPETPWPGPGNSWVRCNVPHARGCWAIDLLLGKG